MRVPSPSSDISRNHLLVTTRDWNVHVTDLHSTNGTTVLPVGEPPFTLRDGASVQVELGTVLDLGDGVSLRIEPPAADWKAGQPLSGEKNSARSLRLTGRFLRRSWQGLIVGGLAVALGVAAYLSPGLVEADVLLDDGFVHVVKRDSELIGTVNSQIRQLANASQLGEQRAEVLQNADEVLMYLPQSDSLVPFDAARNISGSTTALPSNSMVQLVGDRLLVVGGESGATWSGTVPDMLALDYEQTKPQTEVGEGGVATLTATGDVIGLDVGASRLVRPDGEATATVDLPFKLDADAVVSMSAVGDKAVVLDHSSKRIWVEGMPQAYPVSDAGSARLMAPAPHALRGEDGILAIYANAAGLNALTKDGQVSLSGRIDLAPVAPVQVGECVYAAGVSDTTGVFVRRCVGKDAHREDIGSITSDGTDFAFHVNRGVVALNDQSNGTVWLVDKDMFVIRPEDWEGVVPADDDDPTSPNGSEINVQPDRSPDNLAPKANDDALGARVGTSTVLNVLDNDSDPDGDVLTISTKTVLNGATLEPIRDGAGLQITISPDAKADQFVFDYTINDGRQGTSTATVVVTVHPSDMRAGNSPPASRTSRVGTARSS
nr:cadherin-like domain-containing protein [Tessaracoccus coleopterorum]